jgi:hypothetical protein
MNYIQMAQLKILLFKLELKVELYKLITLNFKILEIIFFVKRFCQQLYSESEKSKKMRQNTKSKIEFRDYGIFYQLDYYSHILKILNHCLFILIHLIMMEYHLHSYLIRIIAVFCFTFCMD